MFEIIISISYWVKFNFDLSSDVQAVECYLACVDSVYQFYICGITRPIVDGLHK